MTEERQPTDRQVALVRYENACQEIANIFVDIYYNDHPEFTDESRWVADYVGGVLEIGDCFWSMEDMRTALELDYPEDKLFKWYWDSLEYCQKTGERNNFPNMRNYLKLTLD